MAYWIFKITNQDLYPDIPGELYVYDNTHSVKVQSGDVFIYLDKREEYAFSATGIIRRINHRMPSKSKASRSSKVHTVYEACLSEVIWFTKPLSILPNSKEGISNRARLGISSVNYLGWSQSVPSLSESMYQSIMNLVGTNNLIPISDSVLPDFSVDDKWNETKIRISLLRFTNEVLSRHRYKCVVCGSGIKAVLHAAHISPYAADKNNRANPANGICLCPYCHHLFDSRLIAIKPNGDLLYNKLILLDDFIARVHLNQISSEVRRSWLQGVDPDFLEQTVKWFNEVSG